MFGSARKQTAPSPEELLPSINQNLVDIGGELNLTTLLAGYRSGSFPWTVDPVTWWSPDPRAIIDFDTFHPSRSLLKFLKKRPFHITVNRAFGQVMTECATVTDNRRTTWITPEFISAYTDLHAAGHAHSLEVWQENALVGGIYGVALGGYFAGESMFHRVSNASKAALYHLVQHLRARRFTLLDVQMPTRVTLQMGASLLPRRDFLRR
ncbi:MAG: leucyl/phenylalanyl-tRNA--protein transferase, partial [Limisphaerales bacterium]